MTPTAKRAALRRGGLLRPCRTARAHSGTHSYVYVVIEDRSVTGNVQFPIVALNKAAGLTIPVDEPGALAAIDASLDEIHRYSLEHLSLHDDRGQWTLRFTGYRVLARKAGSYAILDYELAPRLDLVPRRFTVSYDGIVESDDHHEAIVIVKTSAGLGKLRTETDQQIPIAAGSTTHEVTIADESTVNDIKGAAAWIATNTRELWRRARKRLRR